MSDAQIKQHEMCGIVSRFIAVRAAEIAVVPAAQDEADDLVTAHNRTNAALAQPLVETKDVTQQAVQAETQLRRSLPALLGPLSAVATQASDVNLLAKSTLRSKQLEKLSPSQLSELADQLLSVAEDQPAATLARYGLTGVLPIVRGYQRELAPLVGQTQELIDTRSSDNQTVGDLLKVSLQQIYKLDKVMLVFKLLNPLLYRDYRKARYIGRRSGGKKDRPQS